MDGVLLVLQEYAGPIMAAQLSLNGLVKQSKYGMALEIQAFSAPCMH